MAPEASDEHRTEMEMLTIGEAEDSHLERGCAAPESRLPEPPAGEEILDKGRGVKDAK